MSTQLITYFGFGSLVNRDTRPSTEHATNATLKGWRRVWNHRVDAQDKRYNCTSLSIEPADEEIQGVLVQIPASDLAGLDKREYGYQRLSLEQSSFVLPEGMDVALIYVYRSLKINQHPADDDHPIMQSYIDCVMAGYQTRFGDAGLQQFLSTTQGWDRPILNDRLAPRYPRSVTLAERQLLSFDELLAPLR